MKEGVYNMDVVISKSHYLNLQEVLHKTGTKKGMITAKKVHTEVECLGSPCTPIFDTNILRNQKWIQLIGTGLVVEAPHLCSAEKGFEFACVYNRDNTDFRNTEKFLRYVLMKAESFALYEWNLLDEMGTTVIV